MKLILTTLLLMVAWTSFSQNPTVTLSGKLIDSASKEPLDIATVTVYKVSDSTALAFRTTNANGSFKMSGLPSGTRLRVVITFTGYETYKKEIRPDGDKFDLGVISMINDVKAMDEVIVHAQKPPITIIKDTVQYNADAYKMPPNSLVEDLLRKLPGITVNSDGSLTANGQKVQKVMVDGKEFFGSDPKMATRNLTSKMIESVQMYDDKSDRSKFTKIDDGSRSKTLNFKLKPDFKNGLFGKAEVGYGNQDRYKGDLSLFKFGGGKQISLLFNTNNVNGAGLGGGMVTGMIIPAGFSGLMGGGGGSGSGRQKTITTGLNYVNQWGPKLSVTGSYGYSNTTSNQQTNILRRNTYTDSIATLSRESFSGNGSRSHRFNMSMNYQIDSSNSIVYTPNLSIQSSDSRSMDTSFSVTNTPKGEYLAVNSRNSNSSGTKGFNFGNSLLFQHRFLKEGRTMTLQWNNNVSTNKTNSSVNSNNRFFNPDGSAANSIIQDQQSLQKTTGNSNSITTTYTEPLAKGLALDLNYTYNNNKNISKRESFDYDPVSGKYQVPNLLLTNNFTNTFLSHRIGTNLQMNRKNNMYQLGFGADRSSLRNQSYQASTKRDSLSRASYINVFPSFTFTSTPGKGKYISFRYDGRTNQPDINQLQNVPDVTDTLNIRVGNPDLKQEFTHSASLSYNSFNMSTFKFLNAALTFSATQNKIVNNISVKGPVQTTSYQNMDGYYMVNSNIGYNFTLKGGALRPGSSLSLSNSSSYTNDVSLLSSVKNFTKTAMVSQILSLNLNTEKLDFGMNATLAYNDVSYTVNKSLNEDYWMQSYSTRIKYDLPASFVVSTDFNYTITTGRANGYNQQIPIWNASLIKRLFAKKSGEIRFSVNDIMNKSQSITRIASDNYVQDTRSTVLRRYFMIGFFYNLNMMGGGMFGTSSARTISL